MTRLLHSRLLWICAIAIISALTLPLWVSAYLLGRENTKDALREAVSLTCAEYGLHAEIDS